MFLYSSKNTWSILAIEEKPVQALLWLAQSKKKVKKTKNE
jgi:hypothetical protein